MVAAHDRKQYEHERNGRRIRIRLIAVDSPDEEVDFPEEPTDLEELTEVDDDDRPGAASWAVAP